MEFPLKCGQLNKRNRLQEHIIEFNTNRSSVSNTAERYCVVIRPQPEIALFVAAGIEGHRGFQDTKDDHLGILQSAQYFGQFGVRLSTFGINGESGAKMFG